MAAISSISLKLDISKALQDATRQLVRREVLVGIPDSGAQRQPVPGEPSPPSNAVIAYVQEFGDPEKNIPARPFLIPGVEKAKPQIIAALAAAGSAALSGNANGVQKGLTSVGEDAVDSVKSVITAGAFAPLSDKTIEARARRRNPDTGKLIQAKASRDARNFLKLRDQGVPVDVLQDAGFATPLLDTRSMFGAIKYVVKDKGAS